MSTPFIEENDQTRTRREHLERIRALVGNAYPNKFRRTRTVNPEREDNITAVVGRFSAYLPPQQDDGTRPAPEVLEPINAQLKEFDVRVSGRLAVPPRVMGKAAFVHLSDGNERLQIYVRRDETKARTTDGSEADGWELFQLLDHGDFIGVEGFLFITRTGELSVHVREMEFLAKALLPMPDKLHGISDPEIRQRQRYVDLIAGSLKVKLDDKETEGEAPDREELTPRQVFERRSKLITELRRFLDEHGYLEVETPMLTPIASGAAARPFKTHHNALDIDLYARIAPELYLKRLLVGGFERVYELNRNFRNEGLGYRWNPEFTMLEFYCAYMDVNGMMDFCEELLRTTIEKVTGGTSARWGGDEIDFGRPFERLTMKEAIASCWTKDNSDNPITTDMLDNPKVVFSLYSTLSRLKKQIYPLGIEQSDSSFDDSIRGQLLSINFRERAEEENLSLNDEETGIKIQTLFEEIVEGLFSPKLVQPTFITDFPKPVSPLSKASPVSPSVAERFELYVAKMEVANGFSELNDPVEQYERFQDQTRQRESGDDEAMQMDVDYVRALAYGMPPAAGIGIGVDRLTMLLTNRRSIRDVILFPHMRPQRPADEKSDGAAADDEA
ncbi:MAG TPA: lysine--tRNA ligase [Pyrinomonadaceae bacterium]|jgi:lysyl-tRNA synthetase class 2|nr:lysine--tRNA ligase [Pyrinomonadaceae bacterium]